MSSTLFSCPYCNAQFERAAASEVGWRCPQCGDLLPAPLQEQLKALPASGVMDASTAGSSTSASPVRRVKNWKIAVGILAVMVVMAGIGLEYALRTIEYRRSKDPQLVAPSEPILRTPASWAALGYLPADCNFLVGLNVERLVHDPDASMFLEEPRPALIQFLVGQLENSTGLGPADVDHLVLGLNYNGKTPQITIVAHTHKQADAELIASTLKAERAKDHAGGPLYAFTFKSVLEGRLWLPAPRVVVLSMALGAFTSKDLAKLPETPRLHFEGLPAPLQEALKQRLPKQSVGWIAGSGDWSGLPDLLPKSPGLKLEAIRSWLPKINTFVIALGKFEQWRLSADVEIPDEPTRREVLNYLRKQADSEKQLKVVGAPPEAIGPEQGWITMQRTLDPAQLRDALDQGKLLKSSNAKKE